MKLDITDTIAIPLNKLHFDFVRASGPGGQNVNKVATAVQLRVDLATLDLPEDVRLRLTKLAGKRITIDGTLLIEAKRFRTQEKNRQDAIRRFTTLLQRAAVKPKPRLKTAPGKVATEKRLAVKRRQSEKKQHRKPLAPKDVSE